MKKKIMCSLLILILSIICCGCATTDSTTIIPQKYEYDITYQKDEDDESPIVYVTKYGDRYHEFYCSHAKRPYHKLTEQQAKDKGYTACYFCY